MGATNMCTSNVDPSQRPGDLKKGMKVMSLVDMPNYVDPQSCHDQYERVKYQFPFYRMDVAQFAYKLDLLTPADQMRTIDPATSYITIEDLKKAFCVTQAWK